MKDQLKARLLGLAFTIAVFGCIFLPHWGTRW
jgi:hypothetical protein